MTTEIVDYFRDELGIDLQVFDAGAQRTNLEFVVVKTSTGEKAAHVHQILAADLPVDEPGGAIVYCATRRHTEELAAFLQAKGVEAQHFHARLSPETKKDVQEAFINGGLRSIVATNAFGMASINGMYVWSSTLISLVLWRTTSRKRAALGGIKRRHAACCSTHRTT